jgi:ribosomal protein S18 acetylase RimI-like enzyme
MTHGFVIRKARPGDEAATARVHVDTWQAAYDGLIARDFLDSLSYERSARNWTRALEKGAPYYVATVEEQVVGFAIGGPSQLDRQAGDEAAGEESRAVGATAGEIFAIYVLPEYHGRGVGCALFQAVTHELRSRGFRPLELRVLAANHQARRFYERQGWHWASEGTITFGDGEYDIVVYRSPEE